MFDRISSKVSGFMMACRLYIRIKMKKASLKEQVQQVLFYIQGELADLQKKNVLEKLEAGELEFETVGEFLAETKKEFGGGEEKLVKTAKLRKLEQRGKTMKEFVQEFKRVQRKWV